MTHIPLNCRVRVYSDGPLGTSSLEGILVGRSMPPTWVDIMTDDRKIHANVRVSSIQRLDLPADDGMTIPECAA